MTYRFGPGLSEPIPDWLPPGFLAGPDQPDSPRQKIRDRDGNEYDPAILVLIPSCPDRGSVLPAAGCGCGGDDPERHQCRAGRGPVDPDRVTLRDCYACQADRLSSLPAQSQPGVSP